MWFSLVIETAGGTKNVDGSKEEYFLEDNTFDYMTRITLALSEYKH